MPAPAPATALPPGISLVRCSAADAPLTVEWMVRQYGFRRQEVQAWVRDLHFNWPISVKALDAHGQPCGLLNISDYRIEEETAAILDHAPALLRSLNALRYTAVFSFIVAEPYRGTPLNYHMLMHVLPQLRAACDFLFIPVMHRLTTHAYWQRWGARPFFRDPDCVYYALPFSPAAARTLSPRPFAETENKPF